MSSYGDILSEFNSYREYNSSITTALDNNFYQKIKNDIVFHKFINISVDNIDKEYLLEIRNNLKEIAYFLEKIQSHIQYHTEHKKDLLEESYAVALQRVDEIKKELIKKNDLNILNFNKNPYSYEQLVEKMICKDEDGSHEYKVYNKKYYDFSKINSGYKGKLLYYDFVDKGKLLNYDFIDKIFSIDKCMKNSFRIYENYCETSPFTTIKMIYKTQIYIFDDSLEENLINMSYDDKNNDKSKKFANIIKDTFYNYQYDFDDNGYNTPRKTNNF